MKKVFCALLLSAVAAVVPGEEYQLGASSWESLKNTSEKEGTLVVAGNTMLKSKEFYPVDPAKTYKLSATVRNADGSTPASLFIGFMPATADKKFVSAVMMTPVTTAAGELAAACDSKDTVLKIKPDAGANWDPGKQGWSVAFDAKKDLSDLPNRNLTLRIKSVETKDGICEVTLASPAGFKREAGTPVRVHSGGGSFMYPVSAGKPAPAAWTTLSGTVKGVKETGYANNLWPKPATLCQVMILANWDNPKSSIELKDVKLSVE